MEYREFAKYYDRFYKNKNYHKEVDFLNQLIGDKQEIIDVGCGTGIHASLLQKQGHNIDVVDLNNEMLDIVSTRINGNLYNQNMINLNINKKYDVIISMFAVINHLKDVEELKKVLINFKDHLKQDGKIIIDLHNPQSSGSKTDVVDNMKRTMKWDFNLKDRIEKSTITFEIDNVVYKDNHTFKIFTIEEIKKCCDEIGLNLKNTYENYSLKMADNYSKNIQFIIEYKDNNN